jgi:ABC-type amino acid transport substrate-binding protein
MDLLEAQGNTIHWSPDQEANLRMLSAGRLDVLVATPYECVMLAKQSQLPRPEFDLTSPITHYEFVYAFHETAQGIALQKKISEAIQSLEALNILQPLASRFEATMDQSE